MESKGPQAFFVAHMGVEGFGEVNWMIWRLLRGHELSNYSPRIAMKSPLTLKIYMSSISMSIFFSMGSFTI